MPDFQHVRSPVFTPTHCIACMNHRDPDGFIDLLVELPIGHLYLCANCTYQAGQRLGMLSPHQADDLTGRLATAQQDIETLQAELAAEREDKVVSLADVRKLISPRGGFTKPAA